MAEPIQGRILPPGRRTLLLATLLLLALMGPAGRAAAQQANFKPLERGDFTEVEERLVIARGLEVGADYAFRLLHQKQEDLPREVQGSRASHDLRLSLDTIFHPDAGVHLQLALGQASLDGVGLRQAPSETGQLRDDVPTAVVAREAYLRYAFNPRSRILIGKQELSLGDRHGKVFDAVVPAITFDCQAGTWCLPMGVARVGTGNASAITHLALTYNAWQSPEGEPPSALKVEVFRIIYGEGNIPLATNMGPGLYKPDAPRGMLSTVPSDPDPSQFVQPDGDPIYYDAVDHNYYGVRVTWLAGPLSFYFDATTLRGERKYHLFRQPNVGIVSSLSTGELEHSERARGAAVETEIGYAWLGTLTFGLRGMSATGDSFQDPANVNSYRRGVSGYHEIVPGTYPVARLYFNGGNSEVDLGGGLGHSINNTRMGGLFFTYNGRETRNFKYETGLYSLHLNEGIPDSKGEMQTNIGVEWDNMITWYPHKALHFQFELNGLQAGGAFRPDDFSVPNALQHSMYQAIVRALYHF